jgi:hypothetical protein
MANPPAVNPLPKVLGSTPEPFNGKGEKAEGFWSSLENYFYLNIDHYTDENRRIASALMYFKQGTPAGDWACQRQKDALAVQPANFGTWADFASAFKKHFVPLETEMKAASMPRRPGSTRRPACTPSIVPYLKPYTARFLKLNHSQPPSTPLQKQPETSTASGGYTTPQVLRQITSALVGITDLYPWVYANENPIPRSVQVSGTR